MHIQVVNFNLEGVSHDEYCQGCDSVAQHFADVPGLVSKVWLADAESNTYGGVYTWKDRQSMQDFAAGDLFKGVAGNPNFVGFSVKTFDVIEGPSKTTNGIV